MAKRVQALDPPVTLRHEPPRTAPAPPDRQGALLRRFLAVLDREGMASIEEYGDMLKWALPSRDGTCRYFHAYDPSFCSFRDDFRGTVHYHGGAIRGTVLLGALDHHTYDATPDEAGERAFDGERFRLTRHMDRHPAGTAYMLAPFVPHWPVPTEATVTYFEEDDNGVMGDLVDPVDADHDEHVWDQARADAFLPRLRALVQERLDAL